MQQFEHAVKVGEVPVLNHDSSFALVVRDVHARTEQSLQFALGVANVALGLPLPLAAAHNAGAALLLASLVVLNFFVVRGLRPSW